MTDSSAAAARRMMSDGRDAAWLEPQELACAAAAIQGLVGRVGSLIVVLLFIILCGPSAGGSGPSLLPTYWQNIGVVFPPALPST